MRHRIPTVGEIPGGLIAGGLVVSLLMLASGAAVAETPKSDNRISEIRLSDIRLSDIRLSDIRLSGIRSSGSASASARPTVTAIPRGSGIHGYPYDSAPTVRTFPGAPTLYLSHYGYVEHEFLMSGTTNVYQQSGFWGSNGRWNVSVAQNGVPYTTRLLVRYPKDPAKFNGTVVVEWLNETTGGDQDPVWSEIYHQALIGGYAYIGVSAQQGSMIELKTWDSKRYGALGDSNDGQSYDIFSQAAEVARADISGVLGTLHPKRVIGMGDSQSAFRVDTYVNAIQPISHAFDGFIAIGRGALAAPIGSGLVSFSPFPALIRTDNATPFIQLNTEGDIEELGTALTRQPDNAFLRTWELAGAAHIDLHEGLYESATISREEPQVTAPQCIFGVQANGATQPDSMGVYELEDAALVAMQRWLRYGTTPPSGNQIATTPFFNIVERDRYGNALGGIRLPDIQVPTATYSAINFSQPSQQSLSPSQLTSTLQSIFATLSTGVITDPTLRDEGLCLLEGYDTPLGPATLQALYPTHSTYVADFTAAAAADLAAGFLTRADYNAAVAAAQKAPIP
ncbi:MAG TPA: alpha/beta hydrolase domain-containing protein [Streptosporangiaceae bacterium]|nr:alpha/beta hydrolase domain-containing protein [Streptosporangiaceae bacterium]